MRVMLNHLLPQVEESIFDHTGISLTRCFNDIGLLIAEICRSTSIKHILSSIEMIDSKAYFIKEFEMAKFEKHKK